MTGNRVRLVRIGVGHVARAALVPLSLAMVSAQAGSQAAAAPRVHRVIIDQMAFGQAPSSARAGDVILWVNKDMFRHTATARDRSFDIDLKPGASAKMTIKRAGTFAFYCRYHPGMTGSFKAVEQGR